MRKLIMLLFSLVCLQFSLWAQRTVSGVVTDEQGAPIPNVSVTVKNTQTGTVTGANGAYSIRVPAGSDVLVFSSVDMEPQEVSIGSQTEINISMKGLSTSLTEVVVVAYGTQKKADLTGSQNQIKSKELENVPFSSVDKTLQGKVAGLRSVASSGAPGSGQAIILRGIGSINASTSPLFVVDGVPINSGDLTRVNPVGGNTLAGINPNDVESVTVLKDASATSIYGSRAANGVILITTKRGRVGKTRVRFDVEAGNSELAFLNDKARPLNTAEYKELTSEGIRNLTGWSQQQADDYVDANLGTANGVDTDWLDEVTQKGSRGQYTLSVDGGTDKMKFYLSGSIYNENGTVIASKFKRYNFSSSVGYSINDKMKLSLRMPVSYSRQISPNQGGAFRNPVLSAYFLLPTQQPYNDDGTVNISRSGYPNFPSLYNPIAIAKLSDRESRTLQLRPNMEFTYNIIKNLNFTSRYGVDFNNIEENQYDSKLHGDARTVAGRSYAYLTRYFNWTFTNFLDYKYDWLKNGDLSTNATLGYESQKSSGYFISAMGEGFPPTELLRYPNVAANPRTASADGQDYTFNSVFSRLSINYQNRYVIDGSFRRDGSSRFGANNRFGNFWSIGGSWNIDQEAFMANVAWINQAKLRGSYGVNGNGGIGNYSSLALYGYGADYNGGNGSFPSLAGNPDLTWELNKPFNVGIDLSMFKSRVNLTVDVYKRTTSALLLNKPVSATTGFTSITSNIGEMENKGIEVTLDVTPIVYKDFSWNINFNLARNKNKVLKLDDDKDIDNGSFRISVGHDFQSYYARQWAGVDPDNGDPLWYVDDSKSTTTNVYSNAERVLLGSASPKLFGGFTNTFSFKGFVIEAQFNYSFGNYVRDTWARYYQGDGFGATFNKMRFQLARWQQPGDITDVPKYIYNGNQLSSEYSSRFIYQGDYIRLRQIQVGYTLPKEIAGKLTASNVTFYVRGTNLWTWVKDKDLAFDPEQGFSNTTNLDVFIPRTMTAGLTVSF